MSYIRYLLDENVPAFYRHELLRSEPEMVVWKIGDISAPPSGSRDSDILIWCEKNSFILVTFNRRSMPENLNNHLENGAHIPGIIELNANMGVGETIQELLLIWGVSKEKEFEDKIVYLPIK